MSMYSKYGKDVNLEKLKAGFAEAYRGNPPHGFDPAPHQEAETEARKAKRAMWVQGDKYKSPKEWRKMQKDNKHG